MTVKPLTSYEKGSWTRGALLAHLESLERELAAARETTIQQVADWFRSFEGPSSAHVRLNADLIERLFPR